MAAAAEAACRGGALEMGAPNSQVAGYGHAAMLHYEHRLLQKSTSVACRPDMRA